MGEAHPGSCAQFAAGCSGRDQAAAGVRPETAVAGPARAGQGCRTDGGRVSGVGQRHQATAPALPAGRAGRVGGRPVGQADAGLRPGRPGCGGGDATDDRRDRRRVVKAIGFVLWRTQQILSGREETAEVELPSRATLYRLFDKLAVGTHATGSARTRRSVGARPSGPFGEVPASAPGELMQIDSTPMDVLVRLDDGVAEKVELTAMVDIATRSITAAVPRPSTKAADASALLARSVAPRRCVRAGRKPCGCPGQRCRTGDC